MKVHYLPLLLLFISSFAASCDPATSDDNKPEAEDIIEIPDEHFKAALVSSNSVDINGDGVGDRDIDLNNDEEIQRSEAELIEGLIINFNFPGIQKFINLSGIGNFVNLKYIKMTHFWFNGDAGTPGSYLITYDFTALKKLEYLELNNMATNYLDVLDLSGLSALKEVRLINNRPFYKDGWDENYKIPINYLKVNMEGLSSLTSLDITNSFLKIDFCRVPSLKKLNMFYLEGGEPEIFDFHCLTNLEWLNIGENSIHSLILKNNSVLNTLLAQDIGDGYNGFANYPYIEYICIDDIPEEFEQIAFLRNEDTVVVTDCEF